MRTLHTYDMNETIDATWQETMESKLILDFDKISVPRPTRRVRFHPSATVVPSDESSQVIEVRKHMVWYQPSDIQHFQFNDESLIRKYRVIVRKNQRLGRTELIDVDSEKIMEAEMRGLEDNFTILSQLRRQRRLTDSRCRVMNEQKRQRDICSKNSNISFILDAEALRNVYSNSTMKSKLMAYSLGKADATFARMYQNEAPCCDNVLRNNSNIGNMKGDLKSTLRMSRNHLSSPTTINKPAERTTETASSILRQQQLHNMRLFYVAGSTRVTI